MYCAMSIVSSTSYVPVIRSDIVFVDLYIVIMIVHVVYTF